MKAGLPLEAAQALRHDFSVEARQPRKDFKEDRFLTGSDLYFGKILLADKHLEDGLIQGETGSGESAGKTLNCGAKR